MPGTSAGAQKRIAKQRADDPLGFARNGAKGGRKRVPKGLARMGKDKARSVQSLGGKQRRSDNAS